MKTVLIPGWVVEYRLIEKNTGRKALVSPWHDEVLYFVVDDAGGIFDACVMTEDEGSNAPRLLSEVKKAHQTGLLEEGVDEEVTIRYSYNWVGVE
jgi:hypothetical protein